MSEICKKFKSKGPWNDEPDFLEFEYKGFTCSIARSKVTSALCGYVHTDIPTILNDSFCVHGGITWNEDNKIGFDCAHSFDGHPMQADMGILNGPYRSIDYVTSEIHRLVDQIEEIKEEIELIDCLQKSLNDNVEKLTRYLRKKYLKSADDLGLGTLLSLIGTQQKFIE